MRQIIAIGGHAANKLMVSQLISRLEEFENEYGDCPVHVQISLKVNGVTVDLALCSVAGLHPIAVSDLTSVPMECAIGVNGHVSVKNDFSIGVEE